MLNDVPSRRARSARTWLLPVAGVGVAAALLLWHSEPDSLADRGSPAPSPDTTSAPSHSAPTHSGSSKPAPTESVPPWNGPPNGTTTAGLTPKLADRLERATAAAAEDGIKVSITSGRRSVGEQKRLYDEAIIQYGSAKAATRWVLPPEYSAHVKGRAVDIGPRSAMAWMNENGWKYGLCRRYDNEAWHFEATTTPGHRCPPREPYATPETAG